MNNKTKIAITAITAILGGPAYIGIEVGRPEKST